MRTRDGLIGLDLRRGNAWQTDAAEQPLAEAPSPDALDRLVWRWEAYQEHLAAREAP